MVRMSSRDDRERDRRPIDDAGKAAEKLTTPAPAEPEAQPQ
jgi:hypothetical protein